MPVTKTTTITTTTTTITRTTSLAPATPQGSTEAATTTTKTTNKTLKHNNNDRGNSYISKTHCSLSAAMSLRWKVNENAEELPVTESLDDCPK